MGFVSCSSLRQLAHLALLMATVAGFLAGGRSGVNAQQGLFGEELVIALRLLASGRHKSSHMHRGYHLARLVQVTSAVSYQPLGLRWAGLRKGFRRCLVSQLCGPGERHRSTMKGQHARLKSPAPRSRHLHPWEQAVPQPSACVKGLICLQCSRLHPRPRLPRLQNPRRL